MLKAALHLLLKLSSVFLLSGPQMIRSSTYTPINISELLVPVWQYIKRVFFNLSTSPAFFSWHQSDQVDYEHILAPGCLHPTRPFLTFIWCTFHPHEQLELKWATVSSLAAEQGLLHVHPLDLISIPLCYKFYLMFYHITCRVSFHLKDPHPIAL
jgi:hypothetical protein